MRKGSIWVKIKDFWETKSISQKMTLCLVIGGLVLLLGLFLYRGHASRNNLPSLDPTSDLDTMVPQKKLSPTLGKKSIFPKGSVLEQERFAHEQQQAKEAISGGNMYLDSAVGAFHSKETSIKEKKKKFIKKTTIPAHDYYAVKRGKDNGSQDGFSIVTNKKKSNQLAIYKTNLSNKLLTAMRGEVRVLTVEKKTGNGEQWKELVGVKDENSDKSFNKLVKSNGSKIDIKASRKKGKIIQPGTTYFAVLTSQIESDYPGPVLARIVSGNLTGAKLLGQFIRHEDKVGIKFNKMEYKNENYSIDAVAADPNTYRTALADDVDHHYLERYGLFFVGTFLDGIASAILQQGQTTNTATETRTDRPALNTRDKMLVGVGNTGHQLAPVLEKGINRPPSVTVNQGSGMGILFLSPVTLKVSKPKGQIPEWENFLHSNQ